MEKELYYFIHLFKIKGHKTWRADFKGTQSGFEEQFKHPENKRPNITEMKIFKIDRITGEIKQI